MLGLWIVRVRLRLRLRLRRRVRLAVKGSVLHLALWPLLELLRLLIRPFLWAALGLRLLP